jgi:hypothetical protein
MVSAIGTGKKILEDELQGPKLEGEIKSEDEEQEEEDKRYHLRATVASIGVVENPSTRRMSARISTGGRVPRHLLAPRTPSSSTNKPFHNLVYFDQIERLPEVKRPNPWNMHRSNNAGKESSKSDEGWGNNSKSWDSQADILMNRIESNTEMVRNLTHNIDELKELVIKLIKDHPSPPKE